MAHTTQSINAKSIEEYLDNKRSFIGTCKKEEDFYIKKWLNKLWYFNDITYMWNPKYDTNEPIYETETDSQT